MSHRYSTAISYVVLGGAALYCLQSVGRQWNTLPSISYGLIITHSILGIWRWGNPDHGDVGEKLYRWTKILQGLFSFPCFIGQLYLKYGYPETYGLAHPAIALIPLLLHLKDDYVHEDLVNAVITLNLISGAVISVMKVNYWGLATALSYGFQHFALAKGHENLDIPPVDLFNYAFCFVCYFALRAFFH